MTKQQIERFSLVAAGAVIVALTGLAFWLSYAHLAEVAGGHGLGHARDRMWAWPATLDAFIVSGELLMLRAGLRGRTDRWAIGITAAGSVGSIALNVAGVAGTGDAATVPFLDYVVAAVPPTAALLAFGVLMQQIHGLVAEATPVATADPLPTTADPVVVPAAAPAPAEEEPQAEPVDTPTAPVAPAAPQVDTPEPVRLSTEAARAAIEEGWRRGLSTRETAELSTRHHSFVGRVYAQLEEQHGPQPIPGQLALVK
ncbi:DUF2637 domain-containing protein [Streptomyces sp. IBSNAI002]|uniref:DUF2637 domain-containing protein n=1 Tax=Streptomyces sp. IBSNAI002 TaxID=3457500 RepID=UPI003FD59F80